MATERQLAERAFKNAWDEKEKWDTLWQDVRDYIYPYLGYFDGEEVNSGERGDDKLLRSMIVKYANIMAAGLQAGVASPTSPWVKFEFTSQALMQNTDVLRWLDVVKDIILDMLARGKFYPENHKWLLELCVFGTPAMIIEEGDKTAIKCHSFTCGEYALGMDSNYEYNQFARQLQFTASQIVEKFDGGDIPAEIVRESEENNSRAYHKIYHLITPNPDYDASKMDNSAMQFIDYYWMGKNKPGEWLRKGGFTSFPVMALPYLRRGSDVYGTCPGIWSLSDSKQIQLMFEDISTAAELGVRPALQVAASSLQGAGINALPSGVNMYNPISGGTGDGIRPLFNVNLDLNAVVSVSQSIEESIKEHFCLSVFQLLSTLDKNNMTAREVIELSSEKMMQMGPLLESLQDYLTRVIDRVFEIAVKNDLLPPPPDVIQGMQLDVKFVSVLAQAQKQQALRPITDTLSMVQAMAPLYPEILDKVDLDEALDQTAQLNGTPPTIVRSDEDTAQIRQARAQQQEAMAQMQDANSALTMAKDASQVDMSKDTALTRVLGG